MSVLLIVTIAAYALTGQAVAEGGFKLTARVESACHASILSDTVSRDRAGEAVYRASVSERCNQAGGYKLVLRHPAGLRGAYVQTDDGRIDISSSATDTVIAQSDLAGIRERDISVIYQPTSGEIAFAVELRPKNAVR